jgi:predicted acyltransferase
MAIDNQRLMSLDALRGFDMLWIIGLSGIFAPLQALTGWRVFRAAEAQMEHTPWNGFTLYDLIFPLFIFLSGVTLGISRKYLPGLAWGQRRGYYFRAVRRLSLLILLGILYNHGWGHGIPADLGKIRYASVLGRIGVAWFIAAMVVWHVRSWKTVAVVCGGILLIYWTIVAGFGDMTPGGCVHAWVDQRFLPGVRFANRPYDPEGLLSTVPAVVNALMGYLAGRWLATEHGGWTKSGVLSVAGAVCLGLGWLWNLAFPVNKELWTSSCVLVTCGWSGVLLGVFYAGIDVARLWRLGWPLAVIGANALVIYFAGAIMRWDYTADSLFKGLIGASAEPWRGLLGALAYVLVQWIPLAWMYRRKIHIRI